MEALFNLLQTVFILAALAAFIKWRELYKKEKLQELVAWSAIGDYSPALGRYSYVRELLITVLNAQHNNAIDKRYRITEETDKQYVIEIIEDYQRDIMRSYFKGHLKTIKSKYAVLGNDYFMLMLYIFLSEHQCNDKFLEHDMYKERIAYEQYGPSWDAGSKSTYTLTAFGKVFHKMHYIAYMYCKENEILKSHVPQWAESGLREIIETEQITIQRMLL